jgi:hypothetical protein
MATRSERIAEHIAARIMRNSRKRFSALYADALESEYAMNTRNTTPTTTGLTVGDNEAFRTPTQNTGADRESLGQKPLVPGAQDGTIRSGMNIGGSQVNVGPIKPVDFRTITGSYAGDHRVKPGDVVKAALDKAADNGGPRKDVGQFKSSKFESQPATQTFAGNLADSDAGN